jgi:hypothetical protein
MADSPLTPGSEIEGTAKVIAFLLGAGGLLKIALAVFNNVWDRWKKQDEYHHLSRDRFEAVAWEKLKEEERLTNELRNDNQNLREKCYDLNTANAVQSLKIQRLEEEIAELIVHNERFRTILNKFNHPTEE